MTDRIEQAAPDVREVHPHWCDCVGCWIGMTVCGPKPLTWWQRLAAALRAKGPGHE